MMTLTIKNKLVLLGGLSVLSLTILLGVVHENHAALVSLSEAALLAQDSADKVSDTEYHRMALAADYYSALTHRVEGKVPEKIEKEISFSTAGLKENADSLLVRHVPVLDGAKLKELAASLVTFSDLVSREMPRLMEAHANDEAFGALSAKIDSLGERIQVIQTDFGDKASATNRKLQEELTAAITGANRTLWILYGVSLVLLLPLVFLLILSITRPLRRSTEVSSALAQGDYKTAIMDSERRDEIGLLSHALQDIKTTVADYAGQIDAINRAQAVVEFKLDGTIVNANANFLTATGYTLEEIRGRHHSLFLSPAETGSRAYADFWAALNRGEFQADEFKRIGKGGNIVWLQACYSPVFDPEGKPVKVVKYATDITREKTLANQTMRLKSALDVATANMMVADADHTIIYLNKAVLDFLQEAEKDIQKDLPRFSVATLLGTNIDVFHKNPSVQRGMLDHLKGTYRGSNFVGGRSFNLVANPIFGAEGERLGTIVEWLDGAAAGQMEAINKAQAVLECATDGTILTANTNFLSIMGYGLEEIKGKPHSFLWHETERANGDAQRFWDALNKGEPQTGERRRLGKGGRELWLQASCNPVMDAKGKIVRIVETAMDVTAMVTTRRENEQGAEAAVEILSGLASGNLTREMTGDYTGTFGEIKKAVNSTVGKLHEMVKQIIEAARSVNSAAHEIATGSGDLSQRTETQASSLEETAASMEQITGTVKKNSTNALNASELSAKANAVASDGGRVVEEAVTAMGSIEKSSQKISDIIGVIDEIAFQTNLLALNAAVEAARAGDAGKGFAVVASEVRALAGRSASASKEIKALINESAQQVRTGASLVNHAGTTLKDIVASVNKVSGIVTDIARASQDQATGIDEINTAIAQMDEVTQQNAALVEENTAAATSMVDQARALEELMNFFNLGESVPEKNTANTIVTMGPKRIASGAKPATARLAAARRTNTAPQTAGDADWKEF